MTNINQTIKKLSGTPFLEISIWEQIKDDYLFPKIEDLIRKKAKYALSLQGKHKDLTELTDQEAHKILRTENAVTEEGFALLAIQTFVDTLFYSLHECVNEIISRNQAEKEELKKLLHKQYVLTEFFKAQYLEECELHRNTTNIFLQTIEK